MVRTIQRDSGFYREIENLKQFYQEEGYLNPQFQHTISDTLITTQIDLQKKTNFIVFNLDKNEDRDYLKNVSWLDEKNKIIPFGKFSELKKKIISKWIDNGYPFSKIILSDYRLSQDTLYINMLLHKGEEKKIDKIIVVGYEKLANKFIEHTLNIKENQLYNQSNIEQLSNKISRIPFVKEIKKPEVFFTQDTTYVFLFLEKIKNNDVDGILGFSKTKSKKGIILNGNFNLELNNVIDKGEYLKINWFSDGELSQNFINNIYIPYILKTPISIKNKLEFYKQDTTNFNIDEKVTFLYKINSKNSIGLNYSFFQSNVNKVEANIMKNIKSNFFGIIYEYYLPSSNLFFPYKIEIENEIQTGERELSKQWKFKNRIEYVLNLSQSSYLIINNELGMMHSKLFFSNEVFKLGGINSIRGFKYKSIDATQYALTNLKYLYSSSNYNHLELLTDLAYFKNQSPTSEFLYSLGVGYTTVIKNNHFSIKYFIGNQASLPITFNNSFLYLNFSQKF